jgi:hypothetical protein
MRSPVLVLLLLLSPLPAGHLFKVRDPATGQPLTFDQMKAEMAIMMGAGESHSERFCHSQGAAV